MAADASFNLPQSKLTKPAEDILFAEWDRKANYAGGIVDQVYCPATWTGGLWYHERHAQVVDNPHHLNGGNFQFADGHGQFASRSDYIGTLRYKGDYARGYTNDNRDHVNW